MIDFICLWTGRGVWLLILSVMIVKLNQVPFVNHLYQKPWQFIKYLLPWYWKTETDWIEMNENKKLPTWQGVTLKRYKNFAIMIDRQTNKKWYQPKYHLFIIKKS